MGIKVTLPLGLDGSKFRMHLQTLNGKQLGLGSTKLAGQVYVHRARNNNGRTFEVTQAYENKVAGATTFSKVNGVTQEATVLGSGFGSLVATDGSGVDATKYIPGTYYNVRLLTDAGHTSSGTGRGVFVKVVVGVGAIKHVEVTAGGIGVVPGEKLVIGCDTRIHPDFNDCDGTADVAKHARVTFGASSEVLATNNVLGIGMRVGAVAGAFGGLSNVVAGATVAAGANPGKIEDFCIVGTLGTRFEPAGTNAVQKIVGCQFATVCVVGNADVTTDLSGVIVTHPGVTDVGEDAIDTVANANVNPLFVVPASTVPSATFLRGDMNLFYYQAGFYDTVTPQFYVDALHAGALEGGDVMKAEMMTVMGGRQDKSYMYTSHVGGDDLQIFGGLKDVAWQGHGAGRRLKVNTKFLTTKQLTINNYKNLARMWNIYEEVNLTAYVDMSATSLVLNNPANASIKDQLVTTSDKMKNPFVDVFHWTKGQVLDLQAISAAVAARQTIAKKEMELVAKKTSAQSNLDNLNAGKTTMGTLFKNSGDAGTLAN